MSNGVLGAILRDFRPCQWYRLFRRVLDQRRHRANEIETQSHEHCLSIMTVVSITLIRLSCCWYDKRKKKKRVWWKNENDGPKDKCLYLQLICLYLNNIRLSMRRWTEKTIVLKDTCIIWTKRKKREKNIVSVLFRIL